MPLRIGASFLSWLGRFDQALGKVFGVFRSESGNLEVGKVPEATVDAMSRFASQSGEGLLV
jgi:hypothetical protein